MWEVEPTFDLVEDVPISSLCPGIKLSLYDHGKGYQGISTSMHRDRCPDGELVGTGAIANTLVFAMLADCPGRPRSAKVPLRLRFFSVYDKGSLISPGLTTTKSIQKGKQEAQ